MFSNEFEFDSTVTTVMDDKGDHEDVQLIISDDMVYIRQFDDALGENTYDLIAMSPNMFNEMLTAMKHTEGVFRTQIKKN
jgi:hypothetical protein